MTVRLLANENFPRAALLALRAAGADVEAVSELMPSASDTDVLAYAAANGLWLVTFDRDYGELIFARKAPAPPAILKCAKAPIHRLGRPRRCLARLNGPILWPAIWS